MNTEVKHPQIAIKPVKSSQIYGIGYSPESHTLAIQFRSKDGGGSIYNYSDVSQEQYNEFLKADSIGKHFAVHFKANAKHPFAKIPHIKS